MLNLCSNVKWILPERRGALHLPNLHELKFSTDRSGELDNTFAVLSSCPNISVLHIEVQNIFPFFRSQAIIPPGPRETHIITLNRLICFNITSNNDTTAHHLFSRLSCPSLLEFSFIAGRCFSTEDFRCLSAFFSRRGPASRPPPLLQLILPCIRDAAVPPELHHERARALEELLSLLDNLEQILCYGVIIDDDLIKALTLCTDDAPKCNCTGVALCPFLSAICLRCSDLNSYDVKKESLENMIVSRRGTLEAAVLSIPGLEDVGADNAQVRMCVEEGLRLTSH